jgi:NADH-quinone oxidoreductase subunit M
MLMVVQKMFFGPVTKKENKKLEDVNGRELIALAPLAIMVFVIGLFPNVFLHQIKGAATRVQDDFNERVMTNPAPKFYQGPITLTPRRPEAPKTASAPAGAPANAH